MGLLPEGSITNSVLENEKKHAEVDSYRSEEGMVFRAARLWNCSPLFFLFSSTSYKMNDCDVLYSIPLTLYFE